MPLQKSVKPCVFLQEALTQTAGADAQDVKYIVTYKRGCGDERRGKKNGRRSKEGKGEKT
jgi:hypothetical protein